jgi:serine/threonine protein kinase
MRIAPNRGILIFIWRMQRTVNDNSVPKIGDYEIISKIGQGGIAEIYKARQISLNRHVAVKILFPDLTNDPDIVRRFERESTTIARLNHPNIVHVVDRGKADGRYYFVMEYIDGTPFSDIIYSGKYTLTRKLEIIIDVLKGLDYAHNNGVIHRDIKPANILVDTQGNVRIADFGIAHIVNKSDLETTGSDIIMGTISYMSPEQKISSANVDKTTDIYSAGVMIYEILTGMKPHGRFKLPSEANSGLSPLFDEIVIRCLAQDPKDRYQSAGELRERISSAIAELSGTQGTSPANSGGVDSFIGKSQYLDTLKETKYDSTMLVENKITKELFVIKKAGKSTAGFKEAKLLSQLKHKNIANIFGAGGDGKGLVIVMEYAHGGSLSARMAKPYPFKKAMEIIIAISDALAFAHKSGIIHGNLRPSNVLFDRDDNVRVADFGLPPHYSLTEKNWYAPPEKKVSKQGDVYSLGVILHRLLFGTNPVYDRAGALFLGRVHGIIPPGMEKILARLLALRISQRYLDVEEFLADWDNYQRGWEDSPRQTVIGNPHSKIPRKKKPKAIVLAIIALAIAITLLIASGAVIK